MAERKIILALDGSEGSKKALAWTVEFAKENKAEIHVVTVIESAGMTTLELSSQVFAIDEMRRQYLQQLNESTKLLCDSQLCTIYSTVLEGNAAEELIRYAKEHNADMLICGTHGWGHFTALLMGSVAHKLVTYAECSVLVVK